MQSALFDIGHYEGRRALNQPMQTGARHANDAHWTEHAQPRKSEACHSCEFPGVPGQALMEFEPC
jgi:hypothetical protein